jgi:hypothetical protein
VTSEDAAEVLRQLRRFLLALSIMLFAGAIVELWLVGHTQSWLQWIPFVLSAMGSATVFIVLFRSTPATVRVLRVSMGVIVLGTLLGVYEHISGNIELEREVNPTANSSRLLWRGVTGGNPLLAPGVLAIAALLAVSATYRYER